MGVLLQESGIFIQSAHKTGEVVQNIKHKIRLINADPDLQIQHFRSMWVRIQIQGLDDQKYKKKLQLKNIDIFSIKNCIYLGLHKGRLQHSKEHIQH
jgi:hypothetical protein